jgi:hypothetical protein
MKEHIENSMKRSIVWIVYLNIVLYDKRSLLMMCVIFSF